MRNIIPVIFLLLFAFIKNSYSDNYTYIKGPQIVESNQSIVSSATETQFTSLTPMITHITGTLTQTIKLPDTASLPIGYSYKIINKSTQLVTIKDFGNSDIDTILTNNDKTFSLFPLGIWVSSSGGSSGKNLVGSSPIIITQDSTTATFSIGTIDYLNFNTSYSPTHLDGRLHYDSVDKTLSIDIDSTNGVELQIGQEQYVRAVNKTGAPILDGDAVYISGAQGNRPTIAKATTANAGELIGIATQNIADNAEGMITINGIVGGYNTSSFIDGAQLYLSPTTAGALTATMPTTPNIIVPVAKALNSTVSGKILVGLKCALASDIALTADSDLFAPTQKAVKTYADTKITKPTCTTGQHVASDGLGGFVCVDAATSAGQASNYFFWDVPSGISTYETLSKTASTSAEEQDNIALTVSGSETLSAAYADGPIGATSIDAGLWEFNFYRAVTVGGAGGTTQLVFRVYKRTTGGVETELFNVATGDINDTAITLQTVRTTQPAFSCNADDVLIIKIFGLTTAQPKTVSFTHNGTARNSYISSPITVRHNQLVGLQGGTTNEYYHTTANQNAVLGTMTSSGTVVRTTADFRIDSGKYLYYGDENTNGSFRTYDSGGVLITEKRISGTWTEISRIDEN